MKLPTLPSWLSIAGSAFLGAVVANLRSDPFTMFSNKSGVEAAVAGAAVAGVIAVAHLYQTSPVNKDAVAIGQMAIGIDPKVGEKLGVVPATEPPKPPVAP
jgi:hypothetical protein